MAHLRSNSLAHSQWNNPEVNCKIYHMNPLKIGDITSQNNDKHKT